MERNVMTKYQCFISVLVIVCSIYCMTGIFTSVRRFACKMAADYTAGTHSVAFVTVPNEELGKRLARGLVEKKLAACVNIIPSIKSIYQWEGKIEEDSELLLMIKTRSSLISEVSKYVRQNHSYDVAEVISLPIESGNPPYLDWIGKSVPESQSTDDKSC